jgi:hypothetical protein
MAARSGVDSAAYVSQGPRGLELLGARPSRPTGSALTFESVTEHETAELAYETELERCMVKGRRR